MNLLPGAEISCLLSVLERVRLKGFFFFLKIYENFFGTLETSVSERRPYREV